jgi:hypothetical protein
MFRLYTIRGYIHNVEWIPWNPKEVQVHQLQSICSPFGLYLFVLALAGCDALVLLAKYEATLSIT